MMSHILKCKYVYDVWQIFRQHWVDIPSTLDQYRTDTWIFHQLSTAYLPSTDRLLANILSDI